MSHGNSLDVAADRDRARFLEGFASLLRSQPRSGWVDEVRRDQASRWRSGSPTLLEDYLRCCPELEENEEDTLVLIVGELLLRRTLGQQPDLEEYQRRFPRLASQIALQYQLDRLWASAPADDNSRMVCPACHQEIATTGHSAPGCPTCGYEALPPQKAASNSPLSEVRRRIGKYELIAPVGAGAFGVVYKARDSELDRTVAIKIPRGAYLSAKGEVDRFQREAKSIAQLRHPAIVSVHDIGQTDETPFLVTEFVEGTTLAERLLNERLPPRRAAELIATVADALHYAHEMGVVHRDVKPGNIMLDDKGAPRLMDFGLARRDSGDVTMTIDGDVLGTPAYMSPEQARGEARNVDGRSDVYSLGVILYQLLTGRLPFDGTPQSLVHQVLNDEPARPRSISNVVSHDLETICLKAMSKEAAGRYASAREMAEDLRRHLRSEPILARQIGLTERAWRWCRRKPALASLLTTVVVLLVAIALGGTAVVSLLLLAMAAGGTIAAALFRRQAQKEKSLRTDADENLYYHRIALAHRNLTADLPRPGRAEELLEACPRDRRSWEWHFLKRLSRSEPLVLRDHGSQEFRGVAFSPDGTQVAAASGDGRIRVWRRQTGEVITLAGHEGYVYSVAFSPVDASRLASSGNDGYVRVWDLASRSEVLAPLPGVKVYADGMSYSVAFTPDGKRLAAASAPDAVHVWDSATGDRVHCLTGHEVWASAVAFSGDGRLLATGSWLGAVRIWDATSGQLVRRLQLPEHRLPIGGLAFNPQDGGRYLAAIYFDSRVDVWDIETATVYRRLRGHTGFITGLAFHPRDARRLATAGEDRIVRIWDVPTEREVLELQGHTDNCASVAFSPHGELLASAGYDRTIRLWDANALSASDRQELHTFQLASEVWTVAISPNGRRTAAADIEGNVYVWDTTKTFELNGTYALFTIAVFSLAFGPNGHRLAAAGFDDGTPACVLKLLDTATGKLLLEHRESQEIFAVAYSSDGKWLAFGLRDGTVKLADAATCKRIVTVGRHSRGIALRGLQFRHDGLRLASAGMDGTARVWDLSAAQNALLQSAALDTASVECDLRCCVSSGDPGRAFWSIAYSPDGRSIMAGDKNGQLTQWDAETGRRLSSNTDASQSAFLSVAYSPDARWILSASADCIVRVYDAKTMDLVRQYRGHLGPIHCLAASDDFLITGASDRTARIWHLKRLERNLAQT